MTDAAVRPAVAPPRTETSPDGLRAAILADVRATRLTPSEAPLEVVRGPDLGYTRSTTALAIHNVVVYARFDPATADARIRQLLGTFRAAGAPFIWWVGPEDEPDDLVERAEAAGITYYGSAPGMALPLADLPEREAPPAGLTIEPVVDDASLDAYLDALDEAFVEDGIGPPEAVAAVRPTVRRHIAPQLAEEGAVPRRWVGTVDGEAVATARVSLAGGAAGLYAITTRAAHRGRGIGRAMTLAPLHAARDAGYAIGVLQASPLGLPVYRRLGFRELVAFHVLGWDPPAPGEGSG